jgi:hypothetical protein
MRRFGASALAAALVCASPLMLGATAAPAVAAEATPAVSISATTEAGEAAPAAIASCVATPGWTETIIVSPEVPAVPAVPEIPEIPEISHMETVVIQEAWTETVVDKEAWDEEVFDHWQRYSWTGGPHTSDEAPAFPSADWQPNVQGDPHGVGVEGAYFRSHGNEGNGDWFYLEAVTRTVHHEAETHTVEHPAVTEEVKVIDQEYVPGVPGKPGIPAKPAVVEYVYHPGVECPAAPAAAATTTPAATVTVTPAATTTLAQTGGSIGLPVLLGGVGALVLGLLITGIRRFARN